MRKRKERFCSVTRVELLGGGINRLLNACAEAGTELRDISFRDEASLCASLRDGELAHLEKIAALCQCELRVIERSGMSRSVKRLRRRARLAALAALCALLLSVSSLFIWDIEVEGNEKLSKGQILRELAELGVSEGCFWPAADAERIRNGMLLRCDELAWMTLNVRGSRASVLVLEREEKPPIYDEHAAADLVAVRGGVVRELSVRNGRAMVGRGETVTEGQILVSGRMDSLLPTARSVRADGSVTAETWPEKTVFYMPDMRRKERKDGLSLLLSLRFGKNRLELSAKGRKDLDECDKIVKEYKMGIPGLFRFPLGLIIEIYRPYRLGEEMLTDPAGAKARALAALERETDGRIISCEFEERDDRIVMRANCLENIARTEEKENP